MVRLALVVAVLAVGFVVVKQRADTAVTANGAVVAPAVDTRAVPKQFQTLLAARPDPAQLLTQRGALPGLGSIRSIASKLGGGDSGNAKSAAVRPFADVGSRAELRAVRRDIRRDFAALNRLSSAEGGASPAEVSKTLAEVYSAPVLAALGADGVRDFAERYAGRTEVAQKVNVLDFDGIFVSGRHALAQVVYRLSMRAPSGRYVARAPATWTVTLAHEDGRWRFVRGLET
ncbi:hypothetical protein [Solirubrobacter soli]|uniref:hypothetical protein n=1 Tax=Solirubrobacter soli TaxID=363832 RepID=UPI0003FAFACE|nr:hypothetical protein [Solirubrobacter soli]